MRALRLNGKKSTSDVGDAGDAGLITGLGRSPGGGHGNPFKYSCLENPMGRGAWQAIAHRVAKSWTRLKQLSTHYNRDDGSVAKNPPTDGEDVVLIPGLGRSDPLEEEMATCSSSLAWEMSWTEEPQGLQSVGSQTQTLLSD